MSSDKLIRALAADGKLWMISASTTNLVAEAQRVHGTLPTATAALGRILTAAALMGIMLKAKERLMIQVVCDGPIGGILADTDPEANVRGYVKNPFVHTPSKPDGKLDVASAVGKGHLFVIRSTGLGEPYRGSVPLISGELAKDLAYYFYHSEQTRSAVSLGVLVDTDGTVRSAGGYIIQLMPDAGEDLAAVLENRIRSAPPPSRMLEKGKGPLEMMHMILGDLQPKVLAELTPRFKCSCSAERFEGALELLGASELWDILKTQGEAELTCRFCGTRYVVPKSRLRELIESSQRTGPSTPS